MLDRTDLLLGLILTVAGLIGFLFARMRTHDDSAADPLVKDFLRRFRKNPGAAEAWLIEATALRTAEINTLRGMADADPAAALKLRDLLREDLETDEYAVTQMTSARDPQQAGALAAAEESRRALRAELEQLESRLRHLSP